MKYRNRIPEPGTTISGFVDRPTDPRFFWHVTVNTHIFFFLAKPEYRKETTYMSQVIDKLYHLMLYRVHFAIGYFAQAWYVKNKKLRSENLMF